MIKTITPRDGSLYVERNYANLDNIEESLNKSIPEMVAEEKKPTEEKSESTASEAENTEDETKS